CIPTVVLRVRWDNGRGGVGVGGCCDCHQPADHEDDKEDDSERSAERVVQSGEGVFKSHWIPRVCMKRSTMSIWRSQWRRSEGLAASQAFTTRQSRQSLRSYSRSLIWNTTP